MTVVPQRMLMNVETPADLTRKLSGFLETLTDQLKGRKELLSSDMKKDFVKHRLPPFFEGNGTETMDPGGACSLLRGWALWRPDALLAGLYLEPVGHMKRFRFQVDSISP